MIRKEAIISVRGMVCANILICKYHIQVTENQPMWVYGERGKMIENNTEIIEKVLGFTLRDMVWHKNL